jgi:hypothetical protein
MSKRSAIAELIYTDKKQEANQASCEKISYWIPSIMHTPSLIPIMVSQMTPRTHHPHLKVPPSSLQATARNTHTLNNHRLPIRAGNLHINAIRPEARRVLEEVVLLPSRCLPARASVSRNLELGHADVGVHDLHAEPEFRRARLVLEDDGRGDTARHVVPRHVDHAFGGVGEFGEGVGVEVEVV